MIFINSRVSVLCLWCLSVIPCPDFRSYNLVFVCFCQTITGDNLNLVPIFSSRRNIIEELGRMSGVYIKQEISDPDEADQPGESPDTRTVPVPPTQRVMPSMDVKRGLERGVIFPHDNMDSDRVKKFLVTLITFSEGISASAGTNVKRLVDTLLLGSISVPEFLRQLQLVTTFPVRPFVLPFLQTHIPRLAEEIKR